MKECSGYSGPATESVPVPATQPDRAGGHQTPDPRLDDYLDQIYAPLVGIVSYETRQELRAELRGHLEALIDGYREIEPDSNTAVAIALQQFGDPRRLARRLAREWQSGQAAGRVWRSSLTALALFTPAALLGVASLLWWDVAEVSESYSFPIGALGLECLKIALVSPVIAGLVTGLLAPARAALGTFYALALLILPSVLLALYGRIPPLGYHLQCGMYLAIMQALAWMPLGCGAAALGSFIHSRCAFSQGRWAVH